MAAPVVFDTDIGSDVDDALALALALASPEVELVAVTVNTGPVQTRARIAARLLGLAGRADVPVFAGSPDRLQSTARETSLGDEQANLDLLGTPSADAPVMPLPANQALLQLAAARPYHLVATGPFTNVARALAQDPGLATRLLDIRLMGGAINPAPEGASWRGIFKDPAQFDYNTAVDPEAARVVATSGGRILWTPIEVTMGIPLRRSHIERIRACGHPFTEGVARQVDLWFEQHIAHAGNPWGGEETVALLHDPLTLSTLLDATWLRGAEGRFAYSVDGELFRIRPDPAGAPAWVCTAAEGEAFAEEFTARVVRAFSAPAGD